MNPPKDERAVETKGGYVKFVPLITTCVPPAVGPSYGFILVIVGVT